MRRIAHISDLHFGTEDPAAVEGLIADIVAANPHLVAVSGDLTQRAKRHEYAAARAFLDRIPFPQLVVPGNHDIPLYDVGRRFLRPLHRYRRYITADMSPTYVDDEIAVLGINTARSATWKNGRISLDQIRGVRTALCDGSPSLFRVCVTHHPFLPPPTGVPPQLVGRGPLALQTMQACAVDLLLAGHLHVVYSGDVRTYHVDVKRSILVAQAGTAVSHRRRGEPNAYNLIDIEPAEGDGRVTIEVRVWSEGMFRTGTTTRYEKREGSWRDVTAPSRPAAPVNA
jgi:3',5'-cyclic AMP phosphodiesterase CpdA